MHFILQTIIKIIHFYTIYNFLIKIIKLIIFINSNRLALQSKKLMSFEL